MAQAKSASAMWLNFEYAGDLKAISDILNLQTIQIISYKQFVYKSNDDPSCWWLVLVVSGVDKTVKILMDGDDSTGVVKPLYHDFSKKQTSINRFKTLCFPLSFVIGATLVDWSELNHLRTSDLIAIKEWSTHQGHLLATVLVQGRQIFLATIDAYAAQVIKQTDIFMSDTAQKETSQLKNIPVRLTFELQGLTVSFDELQTVGEGYTFDLKEDVSSATIKVCANGQLFAHGKLVAIGESLGVRLDTILINI